MAREIFKSGESKVACGAMFAFLGGAAVLGLVDCFAHGDLNNYKARQASVETESADAYYQGGLNEAVQGQERLILDLELGVVGATSLAVGLGGYALAVRNPEAPKVVAPKE